MAKVSLLLTEEVVSLHGVATEVCSILSIKYGVTDVVMRSASTPIEKLIEEGATDRASLIVVLRKESSVQGLVSALESESSSPVLEMTDGEAEKLALKIAKFCSLASTNTKILVQTAIRKARQNRLVKDAQIRTASPKYSEAIENCFDGNLQLTQEATIEGATVHRGKVRDSYMGDNELVLVTTDRQSGFDRQLAVVPFKGAVLNLTSAFWFEQTRHIIPNHLLEIPHPNISVVRKCKPFPIEFVMRSYMTGSTSTSIWQNYKNGLRNYCGYDLPEGMKKNQKLWKNLLTPTTKEEDHDRPISLADIVAEKWMTQEDLDVCSKAAAAVFSLGQEIAAQHGLILVDTKYEFGRDETTGEILLIDEVHTPDSSRYWLASTYEERIAAGNEPDNIDKEFLRLWFKRNCDPYKDASIPDAPKDLVLELAKRYVMLYELITWKDFEFKTDNDIEPIIQKYFKNQRSE